MEKFQAVTGLVCTGRLKKSCVQNKMSMKNRIIRKGFLEVRSGDKIILDQWTLVKAVGFILSVMRSFAVLEVLKSSCRSDVNQLSV